jgi:hypothetical protein
MKSTASIAACVAALAFAIPAGTAHADPLIITGVTVADPCFTNLQPQGYPDVYNVNVKVATGATAPAVYYGFRNTATGQETNVVQNLLPENFFLLPAGTYTVTLKSGINNPQFSGYSGVVVKPYTVVMENGKKVCKAKVITGPASSPK